MPPALVPATAAAGPQDGTAESAAVRFGWGPPLPSSDEFNGTAIDTTKWSQPDGCWPGDEDTVWGGRCGDHNAIGGGTFRETGTPDGKTGYLSQNSGTRYGRTEIRMRIVTSGGGHVFHPVLLKWPDSDHASSGGEYDFLEVDGGDTRATAFMHRPGSGIKDQFHSDPVDLS